MRPSIRDWGVRGLAGCAAAVWLVACGSGSEAPSPASPAPEAPSEPHAAAPAEPTPAPSAGDSATPPTPLPVRIGGEPLVIGAMGPDVLVTVVEAALPELSKCARASMGRPDVLVKVIIKDGAVSGATMRTPSGSQGVDRCVEKAFLDLRFPGSGVVVATVPLTFGAE